MTAARPAASSGPAPDRLRVRRRGLVILGLGDGGPPLVRVADGQVSVVPAMEQGVAARSVVAIPNRLPFRAGAFATVASQDALEQVADAATAVAELARVTTTGGSVVLTTRNRHHLALLVADARARLVGRRLLPVAADAGGGPSRGYCWGEVEELARPVLRIRARRPVGRRPRAGEPALLGRLLELPALWRCSEIVRLEATPR